MTCFCFSEKSLVIIVGTWNVRVVVASEKPLPKAFCVADEVSNHGLISLFGVRLLYPVQEALHLKLHGLTGLVDRRIQDIRYVMQRL